MKKFGKTLAAAALAALTAISLAGCGGKLEKYEKMLEKHDGIVSLTVWTYYNNVQKTTFDDFVKRFNETVGREKNIQVTHKSHQSVEKLAEELEKSAAGKVGADEMPDMFQSYADDLLTLKNKYDTVASFDKYFTDEELDGVIDGFLSEGRLDGRLMLMPTAKSTEIFMLNKTDWDKFEAKWNAAHADDPVALSDLDTVDGITAAAGKYYASEGKAFFGRDAMANYVYQSAKSLGVNLFSVEDGKGAVHFDEAFFKKIYDNYYVPFVRGWFAAGDKFRSTDVQNGDILAYVGSTASAGYFPKQVSVDDDTRRDIDCYVREVPVFSGGQKVAIQQGAGLALAKSGELTEYACSLFVKFIVEQNRNMTFAGGMGYLPVAENAFDFETVKNAYVDYNAADLVAREKYDNLEEAKAAVLEKDKAVLQTYEKALDTVETYTMYAPQPFTGSAGLRKIFDACIQGKKPAGYGLEKLKNADDLLAEIDAELKADDTKSREALIDQKLDGNFDKWFNDLKSVVNAYLAAQTQAG